MFQAMIFAAGMGTRLKPITDKMPKAMVPVGGEPLIKILIDKLAAAGVERIVVNVHHFASQITDYLKENSNFGLDIRISDERDMLLETGGGLKKAEELFDARYPILIHNVDILSNVNLKDFYFADRKTMCPDCGIYHATADATLLVSERKTSRYLIFNKYMMLVGWINVEKGEIKSPYPEIKNMEKKLVDSSREERIEFLKKNYNLYAFSGIHTFSPNLFSLMNGWPDKFPIMDFYLTVCRRAKIKGIVANNLRLMDVGKLDTLSMADDFLKTL